MGEVQMIDIFAKEHTISVPIQQDDNEEVINLEFVFRQPSEEEYIQTMYGSIAIPKEVMKQMAERKGTDKLEGTIMENFDVLQNQYALRSLLYSTLLKAPSFDSSKKNAQEYFNSIDIDIRQFVVLRFSEFIFGSVEGGDTKKFKILSDASTGQV